MVYKFYIFTFFLVNQIHFNLKKKINKYFLPKRLLHICFITIHILRVYFFFKHIFINSSK